MKKHDAKEIAETITNGQILEMFNRAKSRMKDWTLPSACNGSVSKGVAWNVLASDFNVNEKYSYAAKVNMVHEFGDFLPAAMKPKAKAVPGRTRDIMHQDPVF